MTKDLRSSLTAPIAIVAALTMAVSTAARASEDSGYSREALQRDLAAVHDAGITGVLGEVRGPRQRLVARAGVADLISRRPVPFQAHFRLGSSTKTFVATVILQLVGEGRLSLEDTLEEWLPGVVAGNGNDGHRVTVRQLLQQTSGLYDYLRDLPPTAEEFQRNRFRSYRPEELVAMALRHPPSFAPGTGWEYSNTNYVLAGMMIEKITGHTWDREVRDRIIRPLGLHHTFSPTDSPSIPAPHASAYNQFTAGGPLTDVTIRNESWGDAAGNMISTTADLTRFWLALVRGELLRPVTPDGRHAIAISLTSRVLDLRPSQAADQAVDHALCARR